MARNFLPAFAAAYDANACARRLREHLRFDGLPAAKREAIIGLGLQRSGGDECLNRGQCDQAHAKYEEDVFIRRLSESVPTVLKLLPRVASNNAFAGPRAALLYISGHAEPVLVVLGGQLADLHARRATAPVPRASSYGDEDTAEGVPPKRDTLNRTSAYDAADESRVLLGAAWEPIENALTLWQRTATEFAVRKCARLPALEGCSATAYGAHVIVVGGMQHEVDSMNQPPRATVTNAMFVLSVAVAVGGVATQVEAPLGGGSDAPTPRHSHLAAVDAASGQLWLFGGLHAHGGRADPEPCCYSRQLPPLLPDGRLAAPVYDTLPWRRLPLRGKQLPEPCWAAGLAFYGGALYALAGEPKGSRQSAALQGYTAAPIWQPQCWGLYRIETSSGDCVAVELPGGPAAPPWRQGSTVTVDEREGLMYVYGGDSPSRSPSNALHWLDLRALEWHTLSAATEGSQGLAGARGATGAAANGCLVLLGGNGDGSAAGRLQILVPQVLEDEACRPAAAGSRPCRAVQARPALSSALQHCRRRLYELVKEAAPQALAFRIGPGKKPAEVPAALLSLYGRPFDSMFLETLCPGDDEHTPSTSSSSNSPTFGSCGDGGATVAAAALVDPSVLRLTPAVVTSLLVWLKGLRDLRDMHVSVVADLCRFSHCWEILALHQACIEDLSSRATAAHWEDIPVLWDHLWSDCQELRDGHEATDLRRVLVQRITEEGLTMQQLTALMEEVVAAGDGSKPLQQACEANALARLKPPAVGEDVPGVALFACRFDCPSLLLRVRAHLKACLLRTPLLKAAAASVARVLLATRSAASSVLGAGQCHGEQQTGQGAQHAIGSSSPKRQRLSQPAAAATQQHQPSRPPHPAVRAIPPGNRQGAAAALPPLPTLPCDPAAAAAYAARCKELSQDCYRLLNEAAKPNEALLLLQATAPLRSELPAALLQKLLFSLAQMTHPPLELPEDLHVLQAEWEKAQRRWQQQQQQQQQAVPMVAATPQYRPGAHVPMAHLVG